MRGPWDVAVVGAGPAGAAAALGVLAERPGASVLLVDRAAFPRDKVCGDAVAPAALDLLAGAGAPGLLDDWPLARVLRLGLDGGPSAGQHTSHPGYVMPRAVLDARLVAAATGRGAVLTRERVRAVAQDRTGVALERAGDGGGATADAGGAAGGSGPLRARVVIGADGAHSVVRRALAPRLPAQRPGTTAVALRGYAPVLPEHAGAQVLRFSATGARPCYAWSFAIGDGRANVGYGELLPPPGSGAPRPTRAHLLERLEALLPGAAHGATDLAGHPLPLTTGRSRRPRAVWGRGRVLLAGDAASLVNPLTGEGIYYAVLSGLAAGRAAGAALAADGGAGAGARYSADLGRQLRAHLWSTDVVASLVRSDAVLTAALRAGDRSARVFSDVAELGLARGRLTAPVALALGRELVRGAVRP